MLLQGNKYKQACYNAVTSSSKLLQFCYKVTSTSKLVTILLKGDKYSKLVTMLLQGDKYKQACYRVVTK